MINYKIGNIFEDNSEAIVNTVNTVGIMGKGIALQFKKTYPKNFHAYVQACKNNEIAIGKLFVYQEENLLVKKIIINFPTKKHWKNPSEYEYIEKGLDDLILIIDKYNIKSISIPPLGSGNGGLNWHDVKQIIETKLKNISHKVTINVYEPNKNVQLVLDKEKVKLTSARALLLKLLFELQKQYVMPSEFVAVKLVYFAQKFGADDIFKCQFKQYFYGPYNDKIRHVLNTLSGSYIKFFNELNPTPFDHLQLNLSREDLENIDSIINSDDRLIEIQNNVLFFLQNFMDESSIELLSSIDFIIKDNKMKHCENTEIIKVLQNWSERKKSLSLDENKINLMINHINEFKPVAHINSLDPVT